MTITLASRYHPAAARRFVADAADHTMTVLHDEGVYRHVRFKAPDSSFYRFDLVTWPGYLAITGDVGAFTFARLEDMFELFAAGSDINPDYWGEKLVATDSRAHRPGPKAYSPSLFRRHVADLVREHIKDHGLSRQASRELWQDINDDLFAEAEYEETARPALDTFRHRAYSPTEDRDVVLKFTDTWEWDLRDWDWTFLWSCCAIRWGIQQYRAAAAAPEAVAA